MFTAEISVLVSTVYIFTFRKKNTHIIVRFVKEWNKALNKSREMSVRKIFLIERQNEN
jgi:hypothetical protein